MNLCLNRRFGIREYNYFTAIQGENYGFIDVLYQLDLDSRMDAAGQ